LGRSRLSKILHVIYFFEDAKTKSFDISLFRVKLFIAAGLCLSLWLGFSVFWIVDLSLKQMKLRAQLTQVREQLFHYQIKYDEVFERAYQKERQEFDKSALMVEDAKEQKEKERELPGAPTTVSGAKPASIQGDKSAAELMAKKSSEKQPSPLPVAAVAASKPLTTTASTPVGTQEDEFADPDSLADDGAAVNEASASIEIDSPMFVLGESGMEFKFRLKNTVKSGKTSGYIWGVAFLKSPTENDLVQIGSPAGILLAQGQPKLLQAAATRFGIIRFKNKSFRFPVPQGMQRVEFQHVDVKVMGSDGSIRNHRIPVPDAYKLWEPPALEEERLARPAIPAAKSTQGHLSH
jgi:hypothetical protein